MLVDLVICDVDGCLAPESSAPFDMARLSEIAEHNRRAFEVGDRPPVTVCTGRPEPFAEALCRLIGNQRIPCVAENGAWLYFPLANEYSLDPAITPVQLETVHEARMELDRLYRNRGVSQQPGKTAAVTLYHQDPEFLRSLLPEVRELAVERQWPFRVSMTWLYINCDLAHVSKATGIRRLLEATGVNAERTLGIGDTSSDVAMAETVGAFACPANATDEIKPHADYISPHEEVAGVLDILDAYSLRRSAS